MRRALGLQRSSSESPGTTPSASVPAVPHPNRRRFVRDGEVPVTVIHGDHHQDDGHSGNQLEATRQGIREQTEARERAERLLSEAQNTIRDLQTKLAHERFGKDEVLQAVARAEAEKQTAIRRLETVQAELAAEHASRQKAEEALAETLNRHHTADRNLRGMTAQEAHEPSQAPLGKTGVKAAKTRRKAPAVRQVEAEPHAAAPGSVRKRKKATRVARRGRPTDDSTEDPEFVEWWKPGWKDQFR
jgi:septal ring factor EnvC (AmiA/AmiB activator)